MIVDANLITWEWSHMLDEVFSVHRSSCVATIGRAVHPLVRQNTGLVALEWRLAEKI
ncbi:hypothetical protein PHAMO_170069 [Magnetospirillum molischianum DSM 120]|uniref:Uncharacterized protein n=1 Tax=Magnetospirillum molischianum DSM 120 TaxID=1150626 RepID=H8FNS2_MAGML|nr:hypothetical protein PHAMO_170069 [Magnetospirillum molischianum DSM 120]